MKKIWVRGPVYGFWPMSLTCSMLRLNWCVAHILVDIGNMHSRGCKRNWSHCWAFNQTNKELMLADFFSARYEWEEGPPNTWAQLAFSAGLCLQSFFKLFKWERVPVAHILVTHSYLLKRVWPPPVMSWGRCCMRVFCFFAQSTLRPFLPPSPITTPYHPLP